MSVKIHRANDGSIFFWCPGCDCYHGPKLGQWTWNGSIDKPTIRPSVLSRGVNRCHLFVTDGEIQYLADCDHALSGKTIEMEDFR